MLEFRLMVMVTMTFVVGCGDGDGKHDGINTGNGLTVELGLLPHSERSHDRLELSRFDVSIEEIGFDAEGPNGSISVSETQHSFVDVLTGVAEPELTIIELVPGTYTSVGLGVDTWDAGPSPAITLEGQLDGQRIEFVFNSPETFEATAASLVVPSGQVVVVEYLFNPQAWFASTNTAELDIDNDGVARISSTSNASVFETVIELLDSTTQHVIPGGVSDE